MRQKSKTVYVIGSGFGSEAKNHSRGKYHTDEDCRHLKKSPVGYREVKLNQVSTYDVCQWCAGDVDTSGGYDIKRCEQCGELFRQLASHLKTCSAK